MRPFRFKLEAVRALREQVERDAEQALVRQLAAETAAQEVCAGALARLQDARAALAGAASGVELTARQVFVERCERELRAAEEALRREESATAVFRLRCAEAMSAREALDRLRERRAAAHRAASERAEAEQIAETALAVFRSAAVVRGQAA